MNQLAAPVKVASITVEAGPIELGDSWMMAKLVGGDIRIYDTSLEEAVTITLKDLEVLYRAFGNHRKPTTRTP